MDLKIYLDLSIEDGEVVVSAYAENGSVEEIASERFSLIRLAKEKAKCFEQWPGETDDNWLERLDEASYTSEIFSLASEPFHSWHMEKISRLNDLGLRWDDDWDDEQRRMYGDG
jgi:hypothetical protein